MSPAGACHGDEACEGGICVAGRCSSTTPAPAPDAHAAIPDGWPPPRIRGGPGSATAFSAVGPAEPPELRWSVALGDPISAAPALAPCKGDRRCAWLGTHGGRFVAVGLDAPNAGAIVVDVALPGVIWSTAAWSAGRVWVGADDDRLYGVDLDGEVVAATRLGSCDPPRALGPVGVRCDVDGGPTIAADGTIWVGSDGLFKLDGTGAILRAIAGSAGGGGHVRAAPLVEPGRIVFAAQDGTVTAVTPTGDPLWRFTVGPDVDGAPAVAADGTVYVGADDGRILALDPAGALRWTFAAPADVRGPLSVGTDGTIFATSLDGSLFALDPQGKLRFVVATGGPIAAPAVVDGAGNVFVTSWDDVLWAVGPDGRVKWTVDLGTDVDGGVVIDRDGSLILAGDDGILRSMR